MKFVPAVGRILFSLIFLMFGMAHFTQAQMMIDNGMVPDFLPAKTLIVFLTGAIIVLAGLGILVGFKTKLSALMLFFFLLGTTFFVWSGGFFAGEQDATGFFMRDMALAGASLLIYHFGAGPFSVDSRQSAE